MVHAQAPLASIHLFTTDFLTAVLCVHNSLVRHIRPTSLLTTVSLDYLSKCLPGQSQTAFDSPADARSTLPDTRM